MVKKRVAVFVSGGGTNLQALLDASLEHAEITLVLSNNPEAGAIERAQNAGVAQLAIPEKGRAFEAYAQEALRAYRIDIVVLAGFLKILSADFLEKWQGRILNVHPALLPKYGGKGFYGLKVHEAVLRAGETVTGATVHFVTAEVDKGAIFLQKTVTVQPNDTPETLQQRVMREAEWIILPQAVEQVAQQVAGKT